MNQVWRDKLDKVWTLCKAQLTESSTIRGVFVLATLGTGWATKVPVDTLLPVAMVIGSVLKIILPDKIGPE